MYKAFGIVNSSSRNIRVEGLEDYRPIGAFSFLGRYRMVDFPISNLSNSGIDRIQIYVKEKPRTLVSHIGTGRFSSANFSLHHTWILPPGSVNFTALSEIAFRSRSK